MIDAILKGFGLIIKFCNTIGQNYLVALVIFAIIVKIAMLPLGIKQQKNSIKQANLRPKEMAIRKKYAGRNDKPTQQKVQQEIMDLYQRENFNPMGGCLPLLIQLPILLGLYQVIIRPLEFLCGIPKDVVNGMISDQGGKMSQIELIAKIRDDFGAFSEKIGEYISSVDELPNFNVFGLNLATIPKLDDIFSGAISWVFILVPIFTFVFMFFGMKISRKFTYNAQEGTNADAQASMKIMDWTMPLLSVYITFIVPAVIGIYWIVNNLLGTLQQVILAQVYPIPKFTEEDYKRAEKEMNGKGKSKKKNDNGENKPKVRSLHRIDEEDYIAPTPEKKNPQIDKSKLAEMIDKPILKEDDKEVKEDVEVTEKEEK